MSELDALPSKPPPPPPPLPPPPPPPQLPKLTCNWNSQTLNMNESLQVTENELDMSLIHVLSFEENFNRVFFVCNTYLKPQLQEGPKCGLVALSIATSRTEEFVSVDNIFQTALSLGFTKQGEMFSADSLALLAERCCGLRTKVLEGNLSTHLQCIIQSLLKKCLLLVPYDADFNHSPCCKRGFKAHWAVISGFVILEESTTESTEADNHSVVLHTSKCSAALCDCIANSTDSHLPLIVSARGGTVEIAKRTHYGAEMKKNSRRGKIYLIGRQGKSRHLGLWPFQDMADSNDNLTCFSSGRSSELYLLPKNGLAEGLKGKAVVLESPGQPD